MKKIALLLGVSLLSFSHLAFVQEEEGGGGSGLDDDLYKVTGAKTPVDEIPIEHLGDRAFEVILETMFPTTVKQKKKVIEKEKEMNNVLYDNKQPKAITEIIPVSTKPGSKPIEIKVAPLHSTVLNIIDATGEPWPVVAVMFGNGSDYTIDKVPGDDFANLVRVDVLREVGTTNVNFTLVGLKTAVTITLKNNTDVYHPSPILQLDQAGPLAKSDPIYSIPDVNSDRVLKDIVQGVAPEVFERLDSSDSEVEAWLNEGNLFIRTSFHPSSPLPRGIHHGPAGYSAFRMSYIPVLVMTTSNGIEKKIILSRRDK